jgi:hypothetical protein
MIEKIAKIERTFLGIEDHGIFTAELTVNYGGSGQTIGGYRLDYPNSQSPGTAFGIEFVKGVMGACGVDSWEKVKGSTILVLKKEERGHVLGIKPLPTESGTTFIFSELVEQFFNKA